MLDIKLVRENPELIRDTLRKRNEKDKMKLLDEIIHNDKKYREMLQKAEKLKQQRNIISQEVSELKKKGKNVSEKLKEAEKIPPEIKKIEDEISILKEHADMNLLGLPNLLHDSATIGNSEEDNAEIRKFGEAPKFDFIPKNHAEVLTNLGLLDEERGSKVSGAGFFYLKGSLALLAQAIIRFATDYMLKKGYTFVIPPYMLGKKAYVGAADLTAFEEMLYKVEEEDLFLIATAEQPLAAMFMNEVINKKDLPIKIFGFSPCFRKELGAHGKYTKGVFRVHQFHKIEQFIFCTPEDSWDLHEELQKNGEDFFKQLGLHIRTVNVCSAEMNRLAAKQYDIEFWMADEKFREIGSNSNCTDYQARRLNIRYREKEGQAPAGFVHTINNTLVPTSRAIVAIVEQYQQKDGTVLVPKVLLPYMNGIKKLEKSKS